MACTNDMAQFNIIKLLPNSLKNCTAENLCPKNVCLFSVEHILETSTKHALQLELFKLLYMTLCCF